MFQERRAMFIYCVSPVHMGAGTSLGVIDNPIQRERHTNYPTMAGSGIKGALRHHVRDVWDGANGLIHRLFGPDPGSDQDFAGAVSFTDAHLVALPVRSLKGTYVYATSPTALARARRTLRLADIKEAAWKDLTVEQGKCRTVNADHLKDDRLVLESFEFVAENRQDSELRKAAEWLKENALPPGDHHGYFRDKLENDLVLLSDDDFGHFAENSMVVEPHVRISDASGTAEDGGLFYTENLPPETLLLSMAMTSHERSGHEAKQNASDIMTTLAKGPGGAKGLDGALVQIGGDATTGRGLVTLRFAGKGGN